MYTDWIIGQELTLCNIIIWMSKWHLKKKKLFYAIFFLKQNFNFLSTFFYIKLSIFGRIRSRVDTCLALKLARICQSCQFTSHPTMYPECQFNSGPIIMSSYYWPYCQWSQVNRNQHICVELKFDYIFQLLLLNDSWISLKS